MKKKMKEVKNKSFTLGQMFYTVCIIAVTLTVFRMGEANNARNHKRIVNNIKDFKTSQYVENRSKEFDMDLLQFGIHKLARFIND